MGSAGIHGSGPTRLAFDELEDYMDVVAEQLKEAEAKEKEWVLQHLAGDDWVDDVAMDVVNLGERYGIVFRRILLYSIVVLSYSHLEVELERLCSTLRTDRKLPTAMNEFKGDVVGRAQTFLRTFLLPELSEQEMSELNELTLIRNCIVHEAGSIQGMTKEKSLRDIVKRTATLAVDSIDHIVVSLEYCRTKVGFLERMFERLYRAAGYSLSNREQ